MAIELVEDVLKSNGTEIIGINNTINEDISLIEIILGENLDKDDIVYIDSNGKAIKYLGETGINNIFILTTTGLVGNISSLATNIHTFSSAIIAGTKYYVDSNGDLTISETDIYLGIGLDNNKMVLG
jgi:hypothetical protein